MLVGKAPGLLALLQENNPQIQSLALSELDKIVKSEWPQIADEIQILKEMGANAEYTSAGKANLLASKVYYFMGDYRESAKYALLAGNAFDPIASNEYSSSVASFLISMYVEGKNRKETIPPRLEEIVDVVIKTKIVGNELSPAIYLSIETQHLDYLREILTIKPSLVHETLYTIKEAITSIQYRNELIRLCIETAGSELSRYELYELNLLLNNSEAVTDMLIELTNTDNEDDELLAYQIAYNLAENALQEFRAKIIDSLPDGYEKMQDILTRRDLLDRYLHFLFDHNEADLYALVALKENLRTARAIVHSSVVTAYAFMYTGTGDDNFYRNNAAWFNSCKKWAQFTTIAAVGCIHIGHIKSARKILDCFLGDSTPRYALGGALFGLGLISANYTWDRSIVAIVLNYLKSNRHYADRHGAALALGLIGLGTHNKEWFDLLHISLGDSPELGEASGYAIGLIMLGCGYGDEMMTMLQYAKTTEHDKVVRGLAMCLGFMFYGLGSECETLVQDLIQEKNPILREGAAWVTALAYVGTGSSAALERLLHLSVSDVNPDVRRQAVIGVGFVMSRRSREVPEMLELLTKSYHPHVRSGAALAIGITCAGTGMIGAINLLKPLLTDLEDFVKQSAMIAMSMVLMQQSDAECPYAKEYRAFLRKLISKEQNDLTMFGVCLSYGILNASGRNSVISMNSLNGDNSVLSTVALALFCNYFYWEPLSLCLTLAFHPTAIIGLTKDFHVASLPIFCGRSPSILATPPTYEDEKEVVKLAEARELSISVKTEKPVPEPIIEEEDEEEFTLLQNPCRVPLNQFPYIDVNFLQNYKPIVDHPVYGVMMLKRNP